MTYKFFRLIIFTFLLNSCATQTKYKVCLNHLIGRNKIDLINKFGPPIERDTIDNSEWWYYNYNYIGTLYVDTRWSRWDKEWCNTQFEIRNDTIKSYNFEGNKCVMD